MGKYAKLIAALIVDAGGLAAEHFANKGIVLSDDWPQLVVAVLLPFVVWRWPNDTLVQEHIRGP